MALLGRRALTPARLLKGGGSRSRLLSLLKPEEIFHTKARASVRAAERGSGKGGSDAGGETAHDPRGGNLKVEHPRHRREALDVTPSARSL
jgi:hypothetical protein